MALILTIENETSLPNGTPVSVRLTERRNFDIGRGAHLDWPLPDPTRFISGKHCELRYRDDGYWIYDVSTNGTFLNDSPRRLQAPYRLCDGDRLTIGSYVVLVSIESDEEVELGAAHRAAAAPSPPAAAAQPAEENVDSAAAIAAESDSAEAEGAPAPPVENAPQGDGGVADSAVEETPVAALEAREWPADTAPQAAEALADNPWESRTPAPRPDAAAESAPIAEHEDAAVAAELRTGEFVPPAAQAAAADQIAAVVSDPPAFAAADEEAPAASAQPDLDQFIRRFAAGAGIPEHVFARRDRLEVADELGVLMRLVAENLKQLLSARYEAKRFTRASSQTMIQALDNNPLKFAPTAEDALRIMLGPRTRSYLDARRSLGGAFDDLKTHQIRTFSAMQAAVKMLIDDFDPQQIDAAAGPSTGIGAWFISRKARLWDLFLARWQAKSLRHKDGLVDAFMLYFSECYDRAGDKS